MPKEAQINILAIPYKNFKHRIKLTKRFLNRYMIQDLGGVLYMERREEYENKNK